MADRLKDTDARLLAARAGVALDDERARNAAIAMGGPLVAADGPSRTLAFEAEPGQLLAVRQSCKP